MKLSPDEIQLIIAYRAAAPDARRFALDMLKQHPAEKREPPARIVELSRYKETH